MSKFINTPINVTTKGERPYKFYYHKWYWVEDIHDYWREVGQWWLGETELYVYRLTTNQGLFELHCQVREQEWVLYKIQD